MTDQNSKNNMDENIHFFLDDIIDTNNVENSSSNFDINELLLQILRKQVLGNQNCSSLFNNHKLDIQN